MDRHLCTVYVWKNDGLQNCSAWKFVSNQPYIPSSPVVLVGHSPPQITAMKWLPEQTYIYCWNQVWIMYTTEKQKVVAICPICYNILTKCFPPQKDNIPFSGLYHHSSLVKLPILLLKVLLSYYCLELIPASFLLNPTTISEAHPPSFVTTHWARPSWKISQNTSHPTTWTPCYIYPIFLSFLFFIQPISTANSIHLPGLIHFIFKGRNQEDQKIIPQLTERKSCFVKFQVREYNLLFNKSVDIRPTVFYWIR